MSRQDANAAFALSSFLQGTNATYIDDLYARYEQDPGIGRRRMAGILQEPERHPGRRPEERRGSVLGPRQLAAHAARRTDLGAGRQLGHRREGRRRQARRQGAGQGRRDLGRRRQPGDARFGPRPDADPRLSHPRSFLRQARSARHRGAARSRRTRSAHLRLHGCRFRPQDLPRPRARPRIRHAARNRRDLRAHLLPDARRRVHAHHQRRAEGLDPGAHRGPGQGNQLYPRGAPRDPQQAGRSRGL